MSEQEPKDTPSKDETVIVIGWTQVIAVIALISLTAIAWPALSVLGPSLRLATDRAEYLPGDLVRIEGWASEPWFPGFRSFSFEQVAIEVRLEERVVWVDQASTDSSGHFTSSFKLSDNTQPGVYRIYASSSVAQGQVTFSVLERG